MLITAQASSLYSARLIQKLHKETGRQLVVYVDHVVHVNRHIAYSIYTLFNYYCICCHIPYISHLPLFQSHHSHCHAHAHFAIDLCKICGGTS